MAFSAHWKRRRKPAGKDRTNEEDDCDGEEEDGLGELLSGINVAPSSASSPSPGSCRDKVQGLLLGLAAGDENGGPLEMALLLAESLTFRNCYDPVDVGDRYLRWYLDPANSEVVWDTGPTATKVFERCSEGSELPEAARQVDDESGGQTAGANSLHRVAPIAAAAFVQDADLPRCGSEESGLTHHHQLARSCCSAFLVLCRSLVRSRSFVEALEDAARIPDLAAPVVGLLCSAAELPQLDERGVRRRRAALNSGGFCVDTFAAALHFAVLAEAPEVALREAKVFAGPDNYCPVVAGALLGACHGASSLKPVMKTRSHSLAEYRRLRAKTNQLALLLADGWKDKGATPR